jgi:hypothetical protein
MNGSPFILDVDDRQVRDLAKALGDIRKKALVYAIRNSLNDVAALAHHSVGGAIERNFTLRNRWTMGGLKTRKARGHVIAEMESAVGHLNPYMEKQQRGFTKSAEGEHGLPIPSPAAAGEGLRKVRRRPVRRPNYLSAIKFTGRPATKNPGQATAAAIRQAVKKGERYAFLPLKRSPGIYRITGKRRPRITLIYSLRDRRTVTKPTDWLRGPSLTAAESMADIFERRAKAELAEAMRRRGITQGGG